MAISGTMSVLWLKLVNLLSALLQVMLYPRPSMRALRFAGAVSWTASVNCCGITFAFGRKYLRA